ncbi:endonuclease/exonuclease/phosphatase family protein [Cellulomonas pakistanensis]|uniref:Endonuclease/exonuclease/phosphatase domain-containing protein n=1 Tax=Cellulomonas pakistanensis TaxID=992287 RepID=A0A919PC62_9CELL|nr:endonuclease/exonuclease/phosphatase family protein [Cellulomonas pakistanensis]GIG37806.1 hypothetical protein Cpa01nite_31870 [Cellulomonas pakistanensis]
MLAAVVLAAAAAVLVVLLAPDRLGLADRTPVAQLVALRGLLALLLVGAGVLLVGVVGGWRQIATRAGLRRPGWPLPLALAALLALGGAAQAAVVAARGVDGSGPGPAADGELVVLSFNTFGVVPAGDLVALVEQQDADVTVLAETSGATAREVARALTDAGRPTTALAADATGTRVEGVALLVRDELGAYTQTTAGLPATELGTFAAVRAGAAEAMATTAETDPGADAGADRGADAGSHTDTASAVPTASTMHLGGDAPASDDAYPAYPARGGGLPGNAYTVDDAYTVDAHSGETPSSSGDTAYTIGAPRTVGVAATRTGVPAPDVVVAAHTRAPSAGSSMPDWRAHAEGIAEVCRSTPGAIVAGDLNATLDHPGLTDLRPCVDAAAATGAAGLGTWPADVPRLLAAPIDHVLVDGRAWRVTGFGVLPQVGSSDHRPVVAHLARR